MTMTERLVIIETDVKYIKDSMCEMQQGFKLFNEKHEERQKEQEKLIEERYAKKWVEKLLIGSGCIFLTGALGFAIKAIFGW